jgi:hypothetical protein
MKKLLLIILATSAVSLLKAQKTYIWAGIGAIASSQIQSQQGDGDRTAIWGPYISAFIRSQFPTQFGYETGIFYTTKGTRFTDSSVSVRLNYVGAYYNFFLFFPLQYNSDIYVGPGIYVSEALNGKNKYDSTSTDIVFGDIWTRFDGGVELKAGVSINNTVSLSAQYNIGVIKNYTSPTPTQRENFNTGRNSSFTFTAGLKLGSLRRK